LRDSNKVFVQAFFKKLAGCGAAPHGFDGFLNDFYFLHPYPSKTKHEYHQ